MTLGALEPKFWAAFCAGVGREDLMAHQFDRPGTRAHRVVKQIMKARTRAEWEAFNAEHDCCVEPVLELEETLADEQIRARGMVAGELLGNPVKLSATPADPSRGPAPGLGEHTDAVLAEAGYAPEEIAAMRAGGRGEVSDASLPFASRRWALPRDRAHERAVGPAPSARRAAVGAAHRRARADRPREDMVLARVTVEILGAVPIGDFELETTVERPGRSVELLAGELRADGRAGAAGARVAGARVAGRDRRRAAPLPLPDADTPPPPMLGETFGYAHAVEWRWAVGGWEERGPATVWTRMRIPVVEGEEPTPRQRVMVVADSGNGASNVLDWAKYLFINTELTVHFVREPVGEWVCLDAETAARRGRRRARADDPQRPAGTGGSRRTGAARRATMIRPSWPGTSVTARRAGRSRSAGGRELGDRRGDRAQHGLHLEQREARAEATAHAAAERDPRVGAGGLLEEALGAERERVRVDVLAGVHEQDVRNDGDAFRQLVARRSRTAPSTPG